VDCARTRAPARTAAGGHIAKTTAADLIDTDRLITGIYARVITRPGSDLSAAIQQVFDQMRRDPEHHCRFSDAGD
jgi:hypothetical protein